MKMEVLAVQQQYQTQYGVLGSNKVKDWTSTLTPPPTTHHISSTPSSLTKTTTTAVNSTLAAAVNKTSTGTTTTNNANLPYLQNNTTNKIKNSITKKSYRTAEVGSKLARMPTVKQHQQQYSAYTTYSSSNLSQQQQQQQNNLFYCDDIDAAAVKELSLCLLDELRAAKSRHLTCTEVSLPCDLTTRIAAEIIRVSEQEPCGIRGCTIYIEFEDEPNNSRRIASLKLDNEMVSTFEVYLTLRQDHRGWTALLPQFMKSLARSTITISPEFTIIKNKLYYSSTKQHISSANTNINTTKGGNASSAAISTPTA